jgi:GST-like protein
MIDFYYGLGPNPDKVALFLEETGLPYAFKPVDTRRGEQFAPSVTALNPNAKLPVIVDEGTVVFDSNAILLYLAEKTGRFLSGPRGELYSWLMFVATGIGPYSGQSVHFTHFAPEKLPYAINRYQREVERHYRVLDERLAHRPYVLGETYTIVDMSVWGWARRLPFVLGTAPDWPEFPHVKRLVDEIEVRPAAKAALALAGRHAFKRELDEDARAYLFPQNRPPEI